MLERNTNSVMDTVKDFVTNISIPPAAIEWTLCAAKFLPLILALYYLKDLAHWVYELVMA